MEEQISDLEQQIDAQNRLAPIYRRFTRVVGETQPALRGALPHPPPERLSVEQLAGLESLFHHLAEQCRLEIRHVGADLNSMINETSVLKLSLELQGAFGDLRAFMIKLAELPFLEHVERIEARLASGIDGLQMELELSLARQ